MNVSKTINFQSLFLSIVLMSPAITSFLYFNLIWEALSAITGIVLFYHIFKIINIKYTIPLTFMPLGYTLFIILNNRTIGYKSLIAGFNTNINETVSFISGRGTFFLIWLLIFVLTTLIILKLSGEIGHCKFNLKTVIISGSIFLLLPFLGASKAYPFFPFFTYENYQKQISAFQNYKDIVFTGDISKSDKSACYILIIGEDTRRDALYKIFDSGIQYKGIAATNTTFSSVLSMLSLLDSKNYDQIPYHPNIIKMVKKVGFSTELMESQKSIKVHRYFINNEVDNIIKCDTDMALVQKLDLKKGKFIIGHLQGCHYSFRRQLPKKLRKGSSYEEKYYNAVKYNKMVMEKLINKIKISNIPVFLLYASDHGESLNDKHDGNYGHNVKYLNQFELKIPFIVYYNKKFNELHPQKCGNFLKNRNKEATHDSIAHTFTGLLNIKSEYYNANKDLTSESFRKNSIQVIDDNLKIIDYESIKKRDAMQCASF